MSNRNRQAGRAMSVAAIERSAKQYLSSFNGGNNFNGDEEERYEGDEDRYEGDEDRYEGDENSFSGLSKLLQKDGGLDKVFSVTITNTNPSTRTALITPGYTYVPFGTNVPGTIQTGAFNDTAGLAGLTGSSTTNHSIEEFLSFINHNPTKLVVMKISSTLAQGIEQNIIIRKLSPFKDLESKNLPMSSYTDENTFRDKVVTIPMQGSQLDNQTQIQIPIVGSSSMSIAIFCGHTLNTAGALCSGKGWSGGGSGGSSKKMRKGCY